MKNIFVFIFVISCAICCSLNNTFAQIINTFAGTGVIGNTGDGGQAIGAAINYPAYGAFDKFGNYYFATGTGGKTVRKISITGIISTIAGTGSGGNNGDGGLAILATFGNPQCVAIDTFLNIYISDAENNNIRKVSSSGIISTIAGTGTPGFGGDGNLATSALLFDPLGLCIDKFGNIYFVDYGNSRVRKINSIGIISTVAGNGINGFNGDGGLADTSELRSVTDVDVDTIGNLYIADETNARVRKVDLFGLIHTIAGNGTYGSAGDGSLAVDAQIIPHEITCDRHGNIFIADLSNNNVREVTASGIIQLVAGTGAMGFSGDGGNADTATFNGVHKVSVDPCDNVYICDLNNYRIRKIAFNPPDTSSITLSGITSSSMGSIVNVSATVTGAGSTYTIQWYDNGVLLTTTTVPSVSFTKANTIDTITAKVIPAGPCNVASVSAAHVVTTGTTGVDKQVFNNATVQIYPSPASNAVNITGLNIFSVAVCDLMGRVVYEDKTLPGTQAVISVTVAQYPAGIYLVKVNGVCSGRFVKE